MASAICWFDIAVRNLEKARDFYANVLGLDLKIDTEHGYKLVVFPHEDHSRDVAGCLYEKADAIANGSDLIIYFSVEKRIHDAVAKASSHGGKVVSEVEAIGPWGFRAIVLDPEGNKIALHSRVEH